MLDRKTNDIDARVELLEDRAKQSKTWFYIFFITGWVVAASGCLLVFSIYMVGTGICLLIFGTWMFNNWNHCIVMIMLKKMEEKKHE